MYEVIEGSRRLRALKKLGYITIECRVAEMDDKQALVASIHENMVRGDITAAELARGMQKMMKMMPANWDDRKRRREVAILLGWMSSDARGKKHPDLTRVKDALLMGDFQDKLPGIVIKQRTRGDSNKATIAWSTARQVRDIVTSPEVQPILQAIPPEERGDYVKRVAKVYKETPTKQRVDFVRRLRAEPSRPPEQIKQELETRETRSVMLAFCAEVALREAIDDYAVAQERCTRSDAVIKLICLGLKAAGLSVPPTAERSGYTSEEAGGHVDEANRGTRDDA